jgi:hypothetical protein
MKKNNLTVIFFLVLTSFVLILFRRAFTINFFLDDFFFLKIGRADNLNQFLNFFSPNKTYFYRPIPTEIFYYFINLINENLFVTHFFIFLFYFIGLFFLLKSLLVVTGNKVLAYLAVFMYSINFVHVFQLYQVATFIEVSLFTFLILSFYCVLKKRYFLSSIFFIGALFSKESAIFFPLILTLCYFFKIIPFSKKAFRSLIINFLLCLFFYFLYRPSLSYVTATEPFYRLNLNLRLIINNLLWYSLWSLGLPNFLPDYLPSIFAKPLPDFWKLLDSPAYKIYFYSLIVYYTFLIPTALTIFLNHPKTRIKNFLAYVFIFVSFTLLIAPTLPTIHRWMVRLTLPLIFTVLTQAMIIYQAFKEKKFYKFIAGILLILYIVIQIIGVGIHESSSIFLFESKISDQVLTFLTKNKNEIEKKKIIYFLDRNSNLSGWDGSKKLKNTLHGENFIPAIFLKENIKVYYDFNKNKIPLHAFVIDSEEMMSH